MNVAEKSKLIYQTVSPHHSTTKNINSHYHALNLMFHKMFLTPYCLDDDVRHGKNKNTCRVSSNK